MRKINRCIDCGIIISRNKAKRCRACFSIYRSKKYCGKNAPGYIDGRMIRQNYCIDCGKEISINRRKRCRSCSQIEIHKNKIYIKNYCLDCGRQICSCAKRCIKCNYKFKCGKNAANYKDGRSLKINFCIDCGKQIHWKAKRCGNCATKLQLKNPEDNPLWKGGISFYPYSIKFNKKLKEKIRKRDKYTCQICGEKQNGRLLDIHHINYDKMNCMEINLISLCRKCHAKTSTNRSYWYAFFKYNGK